MTPLDLLLIFAALVYLFIAGGLTAKFASKKGRSYPLWFIYGLLLFPLSMIHSMMIRRDEFAIGEKQIKQGTMKRCPYCKEPIRLAATICRYCNQPLSTR